MKHMLESKQTGLLLIAGALFAFAGFATATPAAAQDYDARALQNRIGQLENQVQTLSQSVYKGAPMPAPAPGAVAPSPAALTMMDDRLSAIEQQQRDLVNQVEKLGFDLKQLQDQVQKAQADTDMRFQQMSATTATAAATGAASASSSAASDSALADDETATPSTSAAATDGAVKTSGNSASGTLGQLSSNPAASGQTAEALYESGFADVRAQKFDAAEKEFTTFMAKYPTHPLAGNAQYWLAETYYVRGDYRQAAKMFAKGYQEFPKGQKASDSLLKLGLSLGKLGKKEDACLTLQQLQKEFPGDTPVNSRAKQEATRLSCG